MCVADAIAKHNDDASLNRFFFRAILSFKFGSITFFVVVVARFNLSFTQSGGISKYNRKQRLRAITKPDSTRKAGRQGENHTKCSLGRIQIGWPSKGEMA